MIQARPVSIKQGVVFVGRACPIEKFPNIDLLCFTDQREPYVRRMCNGLRGSDRRRNTYWLHHRVGLGGAGKKHEDEKKSEAEESSHQFWQASPESIASIFQSGFAVASKSK